MKNYRNDWVEFVPHFSWPSLSLSDGYFDSRPTLNICLGWGDFFITLPFSMPSYSEDVNESRKYGFYFYGHSPFFDSIWFCWGKKSKPIHMPWQWEWVRTSVLSKDNYWFHEKKGQRQDFYEKKWNKLLWNKTYNYKYILKNSTEQNAKAHIRVEEREWRWKWLVWLPFPKKVCRAISVNFDKEIGEQSGSWKGGVLGCGYDLRKNETPLECLRRMEKERVFK